MTASRPNHLAAVVLEVGSVWRGGAGVVDAHQDDAALVLLQTRHAQKALLRVDQRICLGDERGFVHVDRRVQRKGEKLLARVQEDAHALGILRYVSQEG